MSEAPLISVVLLTFNSERHVAPCFDALQRELQPYAHEVLAVDNGSKDGSVAWIRTNTPWVRVIENRRNRGVGPARNQGIRASSGRYVLILDIDTVPQPGSLDCLIQTLEAQPSTGVVAPKLVGLDGRLQLTARRFPTLLSKILRQKVDLHTRGYLARENLANWPHDHLRWVDYVIGAAQLLRRDALAQVGLYDERIFYGPEDVDLCLRMWQSGWRVVYQPAATILHAEQRMTRSLQGFLSRAGVGHALGLAWYFVKHRYLFSRPRARINALADASETLPTGAGCGSGGESLLHGRDTSL